MKLKSNLKMTITFVTNNGRKYTKKIIMRNRQMMSE